jgi:hypothetical protein
MRKTTNSVLHFVREGMENYDLIIIGTGSGMNYLDPIINSNP